MNNTKVVILAGGFGTRISEESHLRPKPMIEIGGKPILWHIMKIYHNHGFSDFIICLGYKGLIIKEYFENYNLHMSDLTFDMENNKTIVHKNYSEPWKITLIDTGEKTQTGGRIKRIQKFIDGTFCLTYGDGLADINIKNLYKYHKSHGKVGTVTGVQPFGRFGALNIDQDNVQGFKEKPIGDGNWINGGFFVFEPQIFDYIDNDETVFEQDPMINLSKNNQLKVYKHTGFWAAMDTLREKNNLEKSWKNDQALWKTWK